MTFSMESRVCGIAIPGSVGILLRYVGLHEAARLRCRWLSCLHCLHCRLTARRSWVRFLHGALLALGGRSSPECTVLRWAISWAFLCGVCMFFPCSQGVSSTKDPNRKNMHNIRTHVHPC